MIAHIKHFLIAAGMLVVCWFGITRYSETRVNLAKITAEAQTRIKQDTQTVAAAQNTMQAAQQANATIDLQHEKQLAQVKEQLASKPSSEQIRQMIQEAIPKLQGVQETKNAQGQDMISVPDTQANRDALNRSDADFKTCQFSLADCQQKQANFQTIIAQKDTIITGDADIIKQQKGEIAGLTKFGKGGNFWSRTGRVALPLGCAGAGAWLGARAAVGNKGTRSAAVGALAGGGVCALGFRF